jgi:hypothetical protein
MAQRTGMPSIRDTARELCRLLDKFDTVILQVTDNDVAVAAALAAAKAACSVLELTMVEHIEPGV